MSNIVQRTLTGVIFLAVTILAIVGSVYSFLALFAIIAGLSLWEYGRLVSLKGASPIPWQLIFSSFIMLGVGFSAAAGFIPLKVLLIITLLILLVPLREVYRKKESPFLNIALNIFGLIYIGVPFLLLIFIGYYDGTYNYQYVLGLFVLTWCYDTFAYVFGISFGKHRLLERISPKKSWEGFLGGTILTLVIAWFLPVVFPVFASLEWVIVAAIAIVGGTFGDLIESLIKRNIDLKDSGSILPGHGGILDRFDSVFFSIPIYFIYIFLLV